MGSPGGSSFCNSPRPRPKIEKGISPQWEAFASSFLTHAATLFRNFELFEGIGLIYIVSLKIYVAISHFGRSEMSQEATCCDSPRM